MDDRLIATVVASARIRRAPSVLWRLASDRVLVREVGRGDHGVHELLGGAMLIWLALDEPRTMDELKRDLAGAGAPTAEVRDAVAELVAVGLLEAQS